MTYRRVLPRDLFNEADLLKCYGRLWICLASLHNDSGAGFEQEDVPQFEIGQDPSSGAITVVNLTFTVHGVDRRLFRPLNSRNPWPLYLDGGDKDPDFEEIRVFDDEGDLSADMMRLMLGGT